MSNKMKNKPELKRPQFSHEDGVIESKDAKLNWFDELLVLYLPVTLIALFVICILKIIIN